MRIRIPLNLREEMAAWATLAVALTLAVSAHVWALQSPRVPMGVDEAYIAVFGVRMIDGSFLPYVDAVSQRGPVLYWISAIAVWLGKPWSWVPLRTLATLLAIATMILTFLAARRAGKPLAGAIGALAWPLGTLLLMWPTDGIGLNGEMLLGVFLVASFGALVCAFEAERRTRGRIGWVAASGALAGLSLLSKQIGALALVPLGAWVLAVAASRPGLGRRERIALAAAFVGGALAPVLVVVFLYAAAGHLHELVYYTITYNARIYMAPFTPEFRENANRAWIVEHATELALVAAACLAMIVRPLAHAARPRELVRAFSEQGFEVTVALIAVATLVGARAPMRDYQHYYIQTLPWLGLLFGLLVEASLPAARGLRRAATHALVLLPLVGLTLFGWSARRRYWAEQKQTRKNHYMNPWRYVERNREICSLVHRYSKPEDRLFVWGFEPALYYDCRRKPASRYVFTVYPAGYVPWFHGEPREKEAERVVPGSQEILLSELERAKPPVIVDAARDMGKRWMSDIPKLGNYLRAHYVQVATVHGLPVWVRNPAGTAEPGKDSTGTAGDHGRDTAANGGS